MRPACCSCLAMVLVVAAPTMEAEDLEDEFGFNVTEQRFVSSEYEINFWMSERSPGQYLGALCEDSCDPSLQHVVCHQGSGRCECDQGYPVKLGPLKGCAKPVLLGDQCFYYKTCAYIDQNADCVQVRHNAICQCKQGYHEVTLSRPQKRSFCSQDVLVVTTDTSTLLGVATGLAIFSALICFVLKLFVGDQPRHFANANLGPPILFASETGIPIAMTALRPSSRASSERSVGSYSRGSRGILVPASRAGAARAAAILLISCHLSPEQTQQESRVLSLASVHSSGSTRSYSMRRFEREKEQKLARQRTRELLTASARSTDQLLAEQALELAEWPSKSSDNALDTLEGGTSDTSFPPLSTSLPSDLASLPLSLPHSSEWPPKNL